MKALLISLLESFGYPVFQQGTLTEEEPYPESFFTFWNNNSNDGSHYDNDAINFVWDFDVNFYSVDPNLVNTMLVEARTVLRANGFVVSGKGYDLASDEPTHTGRGISVLLIENNS